MHAMQTSQALRHHNIYTRVHERAQIYTNNTHLQANALPLVDTIYTISVTATNFLGAVSDPASLTLVKRMMPPPIVSIMMPAPPIFMQDTIVIQGDATFSKCVLEKASVRFLWSISTSPTFSDLVPGIKSTISARLTIAPGMLAPGTTYYVRISASLPGAGESAEVRSFVVEQSPLIAKITGGNSRLASLTQPLRLFAGESNDPDLCKPAVQGEIQKACADPALRFMWTCTVPSTKGVCRRAADDVALAFGNTDTATIDLPSLPKTLTSIVMSVTVFKNARSSSLSVTIEVTRDPVLQVSINLLKESAERLLLESIVTSSSPYQCKWDIAGGSIPTQVDYKLAPYNDIEFVRTGWDASTLSILLQSVRASQVLTPGATYTISLQCVSAEKIVGKSSMAHRMPIPPWYESLSLPAAAAQTSFFLKLET
jgi:hypothetical protein